MVVLVINSGSSSIKNQVINTDTLSPLVSGKIERLSDEASYFRGLEEVARAVAVHRIDAVGHRVVHGGERFSMPHLIEDAVLRAIESCIPLAPLHNPANLAGIKAAQKILSGLPQVPVFDTAFHSRMPRRALTYAIDPAVATPLKIRRDGFHGISHGYVAQKAAEYLECGLGQMRMVTCHLGNGASACAVEFGTSTETSMGMTPLEGPVGRVHISEGLISAGKHIHMSHEEAEHFALHNGDEVEVAITGGPRDLVFRHVRVRVRPDYRLEIHIDIDEASAAGLSLA